MRTGFCDGCWVQAAIGHRDNEHAGPFGTLDACEAVFKREALMRWYAQSSSSCKENCRIWLALSGNRVVVTTDDYPEGLEQFGVIARLGLKVLALRARGDGLWKALQGRHCAKSPRHWGDEWHAFEHKLIAELQEPMRSCSTFAQHAQNCRGALNLHDGSGACNCANHCVPVPHLCSPENMPMDVERVIWIPQVRSRKLVALKVQGFSVEKRAVNVYRGDSQRRTNPSIGARISTHPRQQQRFSDSSQRQI